jgi:hypothetical protein
MSTLRHFAVMWDCYGLEAIQLVPTPADGTWARLVNKSLPKVPNINHWRLRAQHNPQRHYEIYLISATDGIDEQDIKSMFDANPQEAADTVRRLGHCVFSDRVTDDHRRMIT